MNHLQQSDRSGIFMRPCSEQRSCFAIKTTSQRWCLKQDVKYIIPILKRKFLQSERIVIALDKEFNNSFITTSETLADTAMKFINSPYIWGGRIPSGIDCSGFTQLVYKIQGKLFHVTAGSRQNGRDVSFIDEANPGDLVFFDNDRNKFHMSG